MKRTFIILLLGLLPGLSRLASGTTYYVSSSAGNDVNSGNSTSAPWKTIAHVNAQTFLPGDSILFRRGDVWNESLAPASSGSAGNPIAYDAYGTGAPPNLTGYYAVPSASWVLVSGNAWKAPLPATYSTVNFCLFGSVWGQKVAAVSSNLTALWNFYLANGFLYVYSVGNPATYYNAAIVPMAVSNVPVIAINGESWLTFQHFLVNWFDQYGVYVQGTSDHLVFANMEADSMIPQGTQPLGFYVNESAPGPGDIKIYNAEAHMNYDGFRFDGAATAISMVNDKAYANRDGALVDNTSAVTYSYCHFYASSLAVAGSTDVEWTSGTGPMAGAGNIVADTAPAVQAFQRYPARVTLTVDDSGMTPGADTYYASQVLPVADAAGVPVGAAITVGYSATINPIVSEIQGWINAGRDVTAHSISHTYYTNTDALEIQYTGSGSAAVLSISGKTLTITVTGAADSVSYNLAQGQSQGTIKGLRLALQATGKFTVTEATPCQGPYGTGCSAYTEAALLAQDLADVSTQDVKSAVYHAQLDVTRLTTDEITLARQWMTTNLTGLPATPVYVYPGGYETTAMQGITAGVPYSGARGALKEDLGVKDTYADGFNVQDITSFGVNPSWMGLPPASLNQKIQALVWKEMVWGVPWGIFWHLNELTNTDPVGGAEITNLIQDFKVNGATIQTNTGLVNWLLSGTQEVGTDGNFYYKSPASSMTLDLRPTASSPVVDAGQNLGVAYQTDINGVNQNSYGRAWEIGAHVFLSYSTYGETTTSGGFFTLGDVVGTSQVAELPQTWVNGLEWNAGFTNTVAIAAGSSWSCHGTNYGPYTPDGGASLQNALNDAESCRTNFGDSTLITATHGVVYSPVVLPQTTADNSSNFIVVETDTPLPMGQTVCSHGVEDVVAESFHPGYRNFGCNGQNLSYQLGTTVTTVATNSVYNDVASMATIEYGGSVAGITTGVGGDGSVAHHYAMVNLEVRPTMCTFAAGPPPTCTGGNGNSLSGVKISSGNANTLTSPSQFNSHIHFYGMYVHSDWTDSINDSSTGKLYPVGVNHFVEAFDFESCVSCSVSYSYVDRALDPGTEGHIIQCTFCETFKVVHNWFEGQASGMFCGGQSTSLLISSIIGCTDVEDRANRYTYPYSWMISTANPNNNASNGYVRKNSSELKNGSRYLRDGNIYENVDNTGAQNGTVFTAKVAQCSAGVLTCGNFWLLNYDLTTTNNIARNACNGPSYGDDGNVVDGGGVSLGMQRINLSNNLIYNIGYGLARCSGSSPSNPYTLRIGQSDSQWLGAATRDSLGQTATFTAQDTGTITSITSTGTGFTGTCTGTCGFQPNYSIAITGNTVSAFNTSQVQISTVSGSTFGKTGGSYPASTGTGGTWTFLGGNQLDFSNGQPVYVDSCADSSFNTTATAVGPPASNTTPGSLSVSYANIGTANTSTTGCQFHNQQGGPYYVNVAHNTFVVSQGPSGESYLYNSVTNQNPPSPFTQHFVYQNNLAMGPWPNTTAGGGIITTYSEGTGTESHIFDPVTLAMNNTVIEGRALNGTGGACAANGANWRCTFSAGDPPSAQSANMNGTNVLINGVAFPVTGVGSNYIQFSSTNNPGSLTGATYTWASYTEYGGSNSGAQPPKTLYFPSEANTVGNDPTAESTIGLVGAMSTSSFPLDLADWHGYRLCAASDTACNNKASVFGAGQRAAATDGADQGANVSAIDSAENSTRYQCLLSCGAGPWSDAGPQIEVLAPGAGNSTTTVNTYLKPNPYFNGMVYTLWWSCSDVDGTSAHYTWTNFDNQVSSDGWPAAGKKIIVVLGGVTYGGTDNICYGGGGSGTSGLGNFATPAYVWTALGSANSVSCTTSGTTQSIPNYLKPAYQTNYENWVAATLAHFAGSAYANSISYVRVAWGKGGETTPISNWNQAGLCPDGGGNNTLVTDWGYTLSGWETFLQQGMTFEAGLASPLQLMISITPMGLSTTTVNIVPDFTAPIAASLHIGFGTQGLNASDVNNCAESTGDWCNLFATYQGKVPLETQTLFSSCAPGNMNGTCATLSGITGPLDSLLTWAAKNHTTTFEMYYEDACAMACPGYSAAGYPEYSQPNYLGALQNVVSGNF